jgi:acylphosphatase
VRNQTEGSVWVVAQGEPEVLKSLVEYLHEGSSLSQVAGVAVEWGTASVTYSDFSLLQ